MLKYFIVMTATLACLSVSAQPSFKLMTSVNPAIPSMGNCHMGLCSWSKTKSVRVIQKSPEQAIMEVELLGGESSHSGAYPTRAKGVNIKWNKKSHPIVVTCSYKHPSVSMDGQVEDLPLGPNGVPDVLISATELYFQFCHSFNGDGGQKFGYNVN